MKVTLTADQINETYALLRKYHGEHLAQQGVRLPRLKDSQGNYTKDGLTLVYLAYGYPNTRAISKAELTEFIRRYYPEVNDVQQARHLGAQHGWFISSGTRQNGNVRLKPGEYKLVTLDNCYPGFHDRRGGYAGDWEAVKKAYGYRCATCGSKEGEPSFHWPNTITRLQKAHMDPDEPLEEGNMIPQCEKCNRADRNRWVYDQKGRVVKLHDPRVIKSCSLTVRRRVFAILREEFDD